MPPGSFIYSLAERLDALCEIEVRIAEEGDEIHDGLALIAPIGRHMIVDQRGASFYVTFREDRHNGFHCPSVDELFHSVGEIFGKNCTACILTGMGSDGIRGVPYIFNGGGHVIAEAEETCVVYGMPRTVVEAGMAHETVPLHGISRTIISKYSD
jgi:two-component system chemotaxis response regulator CheB